MKQWLIPLLRALAVGGALLAVAWLAPALLDGGFLADTMLQQGYRLPELAPAYVPDLVRGLQLGLAGSVGVALAFFVAWAVVMLLARPQGPGLVTRGWRPAAWFLLFGLAGVAAYGVVAQATLGRLDTVDQTLVVRLALAGALVAALLFWLLSLLGTERMVRPAVFGGVRAMPGRA